MGGVVVQDRMDCLAGGDFALDGVEEADELLMPVALHVAADDGSVEHVHRRKQGGLDSGAKRNALKRSGFERLFQARQSRLGRAS